MFTSDRVRVVGSEHLRLPVRWPDRTRGYAVVRVALPGGGELTAVSVHLSLKAPERVTHTERILEAIADRGPLVLAGDLNEDDTGGAWRLIDVPDRLRLVSPERPTYPARSPRRRLDVVFASPELRVLPHREVLVPDAVWAGASDHRPDLGRPRARHLTAAPLTGSCGVIAVRAGIRQHDPDGGTVDGHRQLARAGRERA